MRSHYEQGRYSVYGKNESDAPEVTVALSDEAPDELVQLVFAALTTYRLGNKSVDRVLKLYGDAWRFNSRNTVERNKIRKERKIITDIVTAAVDFTLEAQERIIFKNDVTKDSLGVAASIAALQRCRGSFEAMDFLLHRGFAIEAVILARSVLEQAAWSLKVFPYDDFTLIKKTQPSKCVSILKDFFHPSVGTLYGHLSRFTHLDAAGRGEYLTKNSKVITSSLYSSVRLSPLVVVVADAYLSVLEDLYYRACQKYEHTAGSWKLNQSGERVLDKKRYLYRLWRKSKRYMTTRKRI